MKYVWIVLFALPLMLIGQSKVEPFEFTLYLEDGKGNKDSLVLGYHPEATAYEGIDTAFGEVDISATPFNKVFEARLVRHGNPVPAPKVRYAPHFKREIVSPFCFLPDSGFFIMFQLAIRIENFPLTLKWNRELFDSLKYPCHSGSYFDVNQFVLLLPFLLPEYKRRLSKTETYTYDIIPLEGSVHWFKGSYNGALSDGSMGKIYSLYFVFDSGLGVVSD